MKSLFHACLIVMAAASAVVPAHAGDAIHYIGFNEFVADRAADSGRVFDDYIHQLRPIMSRYGMTVDAYDVLHGGTAQLAADVVTFGSAPDEESFQAFFADPEFQEIFPMLVGALGGHQVIFTADAFALTGREPGHTLLSLHWVEGDASEGVARLQALNHRISPVFDRYGVQQIAHAAGVMSSRGLAAEVAATTPPHLLELWSIGNAHAFLDDPLVQASNREAEILVSRKESFWLRLRDIR